MLFFFTVKKVVDAYTTKKPVRFQRKIPLKKKSKKDFLCKKNYLNGLTGKLYDYYCTMETTKLVWETLKKKYDTKEAGSKKHVVSRYLRYKWQMKDQWRFNPMNGRKEIISEGMSLDEQFWIGVIIDKLPPPWKNFKNPQRYKDQKNSLWKVWLLDWGLKRRPESKTRGRRWILYQGGMPLLW